MRLARFLARAGLASRRGAGDLLLTGRIAVNGKPPAGPGDRVDPERDRVTLNGRPLAPLGVSWLAFHKPPGYVTSRRGTVRHRSLFALLPAAPRGLLTVGRLDVYSEGLLLCTTDGDAAHRLMHPRWQVPRTYRVRVTGALGRAARAALSRGVPLDGEAPVHPTAWRFRPGAGGGELELELREGRSRLVRRVVAALGLGTRRLVRVAYGPIRLGALERGRARPLSPSEIAALYGAVGLPLPPSFR